MKTRNNKRTLLISILSMLLCVTMLIGSTFAWFTDSVAASKNKIVAGNLDIEVTHINSALDEAENLQDADKLFPVDLWEPGVVAYETFTVENVGSLAFDYIFSFNPSDFNNVVTADDVQTEYNLTDVIKIGMIDGEIAEGTERDDIIKAVNDAKGFEALKKSTISGYMQAADKDGEPGQSEKTFTIVAYWEPTDDDDNYNVNNGKTVDKKNSNGEDQLYIDITIDVVAKQRPYEEDSFDKNYDKDAEFFEIGSVERYEYLVSQGYTGVKDVRELFNSLNAGDEKIVFADNIGYYGSISANDNALIDLNGKIMGSVDSTALGVSAGKNIVVKNGTLVSNAPSKNADGTQKIAAVALNLGGTLKLENVDVSVPYQYGVYSTGNSVTEIQGGSIAAGYKEAVYTDVNSTANISVTGTKISSVGHAVSLLGNSKVVFDDCDISSSSFGGYAIATNGSGSLGTNITIKNTRINNINGNVAVYLPAGTVEMDDCTVSGPVVISGGNVTIEGGTYTTMCGVKEIPYVWHEADTWKFVQDFKKFDGAGSMNDAILIIDRRAGDEYYKIDSVVIDGVTFNTRFTDPTGVEQTAYAIKYVDLNNSTFAKVTPVIKNSTYNHKLEDGSDPIMILDSEPVSMFAIRDTMANNVQFNSEVEQGEIPEISSAEITEAPIDAFEW